MASSISRRGFVRLASDAFLTLPAVLGGVLYTTSPQEALAATSAPEGEEHGGTLEKPTDQAGVLLIVLKMSEVGFLVVDMGSEEKKPVPGAYVKVTSRYNQKVADGYTKEDGQLTLDISELAENPDNLAELKTFNFNGQVEVTCDGYRSYTTGIMRIEGGQGHIAPTRQLTDGLPYPAMATFSDWDVLYTENEFNSSASNTEERTLSVSVHDLPDDGDATVRLVERESGKECCAVQARPSNGVLTANFAQDFLNTTSSHALAADRDFLIEVTTNNRLTYDFPLHLKVIEAVFDGLKQSSDEVAAPISTNKTSGLKFKLPAQFPLGGSDSFSMWLPEFPINIYGDPFGYVQLTLKTPAWGYVNDSGKPEENGWKFFPRKSVEDQINKLGEKMSKTLDKTGAAMDRKGAFRQIEYSRTFKASGNLQFAALAKWDREKATFQGNFVGQVVIALAFSMSENFFAGPIPVLVQFSVNSSFTVSLGGGLYVTPDPAIKKPSLWDTIRSFDRYRWDFTNTGLSFTLVISPALSIGVGVKGIASISVRGSFTFTAFLGITYRGELDPKTHPLPHYILGYSLNADLVIEFFLFTKVFSLWEGKDNNWKNNWMNGTKAQADDQELPSKSPTSLEEFLADMRPVTDEMLLESKEFTYKGGLSGQSDETIPGPVLRETYVEDAIEVQDGVFIPCVMYTLEMPDAATPEEEGAAQGETADVREEGATAPMEGSASATERVEDGATQSEGLGSEGLDSEGLEPEGEQGGPQAESLLAAGAGLAAQADVADVQPVGEEQPEAGDALPVGEEQPEAGDALPVGEEQPEQSADGAQTGDSEPETTSAMPFPTYPIPEYEPVWEQQGMGLSALADTQLGVRGIGAKGGIQPIADRPLLFESTSEAMQHLTYGNPRVQVVDVNGEGLLLRLGSVVVNGQPRTRLIATVLSGPFRASGTRQVLDFEFDKSVGISRADVCDYEFSAISDTFSKSPFAGVISDPELAEGGFILRVAFVSGVRHTDSLASAATELVFSCVQFRHNGKEGGNPFSAIHSKVSWAGSKVYGSSSDLPAYHCISSLQINVYSKSEGVKPVVTISFLDRMADTKENVLSSDSSKVTVRMGLILAYSGDQEKVGKTFLVLEPRFLDSLLGTPFDPSTYELIFWPSNSFSITFMARGAKLAYYFVLNIIRMGPRDISQGSWKVTFQHLGSIDPRIRLHATDLRPVSDYSGQRFLATERSEDNQAVDGQLSAALVKFDQDVNAFTMQFSKVGPSNFGIASFKVWGDFIYWPESRVGEGALEVDENGEPHDGPQEFESHLMAARLRNGQFSDPFIMADLDHCIDDLVSLSGTNAALTVVSSEFVDRQKNGGILWYTSIPFVRTVTALGAEAPEPFVTPGKTCTFYVTLRNDGNTYLQGCEIAMFESGVEQASGWLTFAANTMVESNWNQLNDDGTFTNVEDDFALPPGKTSVYAIELLIPGEWEGQHKVTFVSRNPSVAAGITAQAEDDIEFHLPPTEIPMDMVAVDAGTVDVARFHDAPVSVRATSDSSAGTGGESSGGNGSASNGSGSGAGGSSSGSSSANGSKNSTPNTGDPSSLAAAGLAAAGIAIAAAGMSRK